MQFYFLAWEEASSTHTQGASPFLIQWLHISMPFSAIFFPTAGAAFIFFCCEVESLLHGEGGCTASFQEGAQPKLSWHKDPDVQRAEYLELPCQFGDLIGGVAKDVEKDFDPRVTILQN